MEPIAVIGIGCRFPAASGIGQFWQLLKNGVDAISEVPKTRWNIDALYDPDHTRAGKMNTRFGGFVDGMDLFDPEFFRISPREASRMDPQQRILLEVAWEALETAGVVPDTLKGTSTGVFIGVASDDYCRLNLSNLNASDAYACTGSTFSIAANRLSYFFDLHGPSMAIDSACSSSLVAIHLACRSLSDGESTLALAGGVNALLDPALTVNFSRAGFMSPDGRCKAFDATANGYVRGEGAGIVILKPLSKAEADRDPIFAIIRGTAVNQDGRSNGLTAPNQGSQIAVLREAYRRAGIPPLEVQYVEAHGTGTALGDPIEAKALSTVLCEGRSPESTLRIGSVKSNIGHLEAAAGIAGFIKVVLAMQNRQIPPSLHFSEANPYIPFDELRLNVQAKLGSWPDDSKQLVAGVSSFGFGGTNAHAVIQEAPPAGSSAERVSAETGRQYFLPLSARTPESLLELAGDYHKFLAENTGPSLKDVAYTACARRSHHDHRLVVIAPSAEQAREKLEAFVHGEVLNGMSSGHRRRQCGVVFVFPGQGPQWWAMGRQLLAEEPVFLETIENCDRILAGWADWSILQELSADQSGSRLNQAQFVQPVMFAFQIALAALWRSWGIVPSAVIGHSFGEIAAACVAGALSLEDALRIVYHRGRLMQTVAGPGRTAAVALPLAEARILIEAEDNHLSIAAHNSPSSCTVSGDRQQVEVLLERLQKRGIFCRQLPVDLAFHSQHMDRIMALLAAELKDLRAHESEIPIYSTVTGSLISGSELDADYWRRNMRDTVQFATAIDKLAGQQPQIFLELSPHPVLAGNISECLRDAGLEAHTLASLRRGQPERASMLESLGYIYAQGGKVDWQGLLGEVGSCVQLPTYKFKRERYWLEAGGNAQPEFSPPTKTEDQAVHPPVPAPASTSDAGAETASIPGFDIDDCAYGISWTQKDLAGKCDGGGSWLIVADQGGVGEALGKTIRELGGNSYTVSAGELPAGDIFEAVPEGDLRSLRGVIHLASLDLPVSAQDDRGLEAAMKLLTGDLLNLAKQIAARTTNLCLVTRGVHVLDSQTTAPNLASWPIWGLGRTLSFENPNIKCKLIDLDGQGQDNPQALLADISGDDEMQVAYRNKERYVLRLTRAPLACTEAKPISSTGTYVVTGGLGALGLKLSSWLVEAGARHLALVGRSEPSPEAKALLEQLRKQGVEIVVTTGDVSCRDDLSSVLSSIRQAMPPIKGLIHAAGTLDDGLLINQSEERFSKVLKPKIQGSWNLHALTRDDDLDFFVLFSSLASVLGSPGQANYAAANAFLDGLAHYRQALGLKALSINWGPWSEVGMAARQGSGARLASQGLSGIPPAVGVQWMSSLLAQENAEIVVAAVDWPGWAKAMPLAAVPSWLDNLCVPCQDGGQKPGAGGNGHGTREQLLSMPTTERSQAVQDYMCGYLSKILKMPASKVPKDQPLNNMGLDSLIALEFEDSLHTELGTTIPMSELLRGPSILELSELVLSQLSVEAQSAQGSLATHD